jgi:excinuclease ABC subunit B
MTREAMLAKLVDMLYERNDIAFERGRFRVRGDVVEVQPGEPRRGGDSHSSSSATKSTAFRVSIRSLGSVHDQLTMINALSGEAIRDTLRQTAEAMRTIRDEMDERIITFEKQGKLLEAQRIKMRTEYDLEMMQEMGFCSGIENYSRHLSGRPPGSRPFTLLDFFPRDYLTVIDESHATVPQIGGMYEGDRSRKTTLVEYGFRLPARWIIDRCVS